MQIHLRDYKSTSALVSGLASNRLQLCMLVLSKLRETYWSAGVMYRLFTRAQNLIKTSKQPPLPPATTTGNSTPTVQRSQTHQPSLQSLQNSIQHHQHQHQHQPDVPGLDASASNLPTYDDTGPLSWNASSYFGSVDQLLSPGFALSEDTFLSLFPDDDSILHTPYDTLAPMGDSLIGL